MSKYDYQKKVQEDAQDIFDEYIDAFTEEEQPCYEYVSMDDFTQEFYQWIDTPLHEWVDNTCFYNYEPEDICDYTDNLESDTGLWEGISDWRKIREAIAFWSLKSDIWFAVEEKLKELYSVAECDAETEDDEEK